MNVDVDRGIFVDLPVVDLHAEAPVVKSAPLDFVSDNVSPRSIGSSISSELDRANSKPSADGPSARRTNIPQEAASSAWDMGSASSSQSWEQIVAQQQQQLNQMMISNQALLQQNLQMQENYLSHSRATPGADRTANNEISRGLQETLQALQSSVESLVRGQAQQQETIEAISNQMQLLRRSRHGPSVSPRAAQSTRSTTPTRRETTAADRTTVPLPVPRPRGADASPQNISDLLASQLSRVLGVETDSGDANAQSGGRSSASHGTVGQMVVMVDHGPAFHAAFPAATSDTREAGLAEDDAATSPATPSDTTPARVPQQEVPQQLGQMIAQEISRALMGGHGEGGNLLPSAVDPAAAQAEGNTGDAGNARASPVSGQVVVMIEPASGGIGGVNPGMPPFGGAPSILELVTMLSEMDGPRGVSPASAADIARLPEIVVQSSDETQGIEGENCPVCMDQFRDGHRVRRLSCSHVFHIGCVDRWLRMHNSCPTCRTSITPANTSEGAAPTAPPTAPPLVPGPSTVNVQGSSPNPDPAATASPGRHLVADIMIPISTSRVINPVRGASANVSGIQSPMDPLLRTLLSMASNTVPAPSPPSVFTRGSLQGLMMGSLPVPTDISQTLVPPPMRLLGGGRRAARATSRNHTASRRAAQMECGRCAFCGADSATQRCSRCHVAWYCGRDCQRSHHAEHREECRAARRQTQASRQNQSNATQENQEDCETQQDCDQ